MTITAAPTADHVVELCRRHLGRARAVLGELIGSPLEVRSSRSLVFDASGERYLDCGGYGVFLLGHGHPDVLAAVHGQLELHALPTRILLDPVVAEAAAALAAVAPAGLEHVYFTTSGTEAVELALKLGRASGRRRIVAMHGGYHGKTLGALSATGRALYREPFLPLLPDVQHIPFGDAQALDTTLASGPPATVILEPVQSEGGVVVPPLSYLRAVQQACATHDAMLVIDEIQTGLGRVGRWWAIDREGVIPDILLAGKTLSGGLVPVAAVVANARAFEPIDRDPFIHSSTFGGSPLASAAAKATIEVISRDAVVPHAAQLGVRLKAEISSLVDRLCPHLISDVRGEGLLIGIEFATDELAGELMLELLDGRVLANHSLNAGRVIRLTPPVTLSESEIDWLLSALERALRRLSRTHRPAPNQGER